MRKPIIILLLVIPLSLSAYTWVPFGPPGIHANDMVFNVGADNLIVICANDGLYISDSSMNWDHYTTFGLPVKGAVPFNDTSFIFIMGDGSWSDGIYLFSLNSLQHSVLEWAYLPEFIYKSDFDDYYYAGFFYGVLFSETGVDWQEIPYFSGKHCVWMDCSYDNYVVAQYDTVHDIHFSGDAGKKWMAANCPYIITDFRFKCTGELYGVFPSYSNSSGLYSSMDYGLSWDLESYSDNMSTLGYDACANIFTGWKSSGGAAEGVAIYNPITKTFDFVNNGLPNKYINKFRYDPIMSSIAMFACTDSGVYIIQNYLVDIDEELSAQDGISIFPNPFRDQTTIELGTKADDQDIKIDVYNSNGELVRTLQQKLTKGTSQQIQFYRNDLKAGVYFLRLKSKGIVSYKRMLIIG